jgi:hypothetical protein
VTQQAFDAKVREINGKIPVMNDGQIILALMKLMVSLQDGHTAVWDIGEHPLFRKAPLRLFWSEEGVFVTAADPKYKDLLGAQVVTFDGRPAETVLRPWSLTSLATAEIPKSRKLERPI